jgi:hypothetical protein
MADAASPENFSSQMEFDMNDVALCFAALEVIAKEAPANENGGQRDEIRSKILAPGSKLNAEERAIRKGAADLLDAVRGRRC